MIFHHMGGYCLGDCWTWTNYMLQVSVGIQDTVVISRDLPRKAESKEVAYDLVDRIGRLLDSAGDFMWTDDKGDTVTEQAKIWSPPLGYPRLPLRPDLRWDGGSSGCIALQLDGRSGASAKNPPPGHLARFLQLPKVVQLGLPLTLEESIAVMRTCRFMIAVCSGMSHVAHACGIPLIIVEYQQPVLPWHPAPNDPRTPWQYARGTEAALAMAQALLRRPNHVQ